MEQKVMTRHGKKSITRHGKKVSQAAWFPSWQIYVFECNLTEEPQDVIVPEETANLVMMFVTRF